jgi:myo-inositol 2-dehydrogenase / D-chiro-inositol 1-dehydrogenase
VTAGPVDEVRIGLVGAGMMGLEHARNLLPVEGVRITAVADPEPASRQAAAELLKDHAPALYAEHRGLIAAGECDAVVVASPNMTHAGIALDVVDAGLPVLIEKPMATTVEDCRRLVDIAGRDKALVWVGLEYRYMPPISRLLDEVAAGAVGTVRMVAIREHRFPFLDKVGNWNRFNRNTGGTLVEKCCHFFDLMRLVTGSEAVRVMASGAQDHNHVDERYDGERPDIIDNAYVIVELADGSRGMLDLCMFADASRNEQEISVVGTDGKLEALIPEGTVRIGRRGRDRLGQVEEIDASRSDAVYEGLHHGSSYRQDAGFVDAVRAGMPAEVGPDAGLASVAIGVAAHRSIAQRRPVELEEVLHGHA